MSKQKFHPSPEAQQRVLDAHAMELSREGHQPQTQMSAQDTSPLAMMVEAKKAGMDLAEIKEMMDLQDRHDAKVAKREFDAAMAEFKRDPPQVIRDKENAQYGSRYASIGNLVNTINAAMGPFGLNAKWDFDETDQGVIVCTCVLRHVAGHQESVTMRGPIDTSGSKNALQQRRSTRTYLRIDTYEAVTGIATDYAEDDDGNGAGPPVDKITEDQVLAIESRITDNDLPMDAFMSWLASFGIQRIEDIPVDYFAKVMSKIDVTITARKDKA